MKIDPQKIIRKPGRQLDANVGDDCLIELQGVGGKFRSLLLGWEQAKYLMLKLPTKLDMRDFLYAGKLVIVRYLNSEGQISGFESAIQASLYAPQRILFVDYPQTIETISLRREERVDCFVPGMIYYADYEISGHVINISKNGCKFSVEDGDIHRAKALKEEDVVLVMFSMLNSDLNFSLFGTLKKIITGDNRLQWGIEFKEVPSDALDEIEGYVNDVKKHFGLDDD